MVLLVACHCAVAVSLVATEGTQGDWENKMWNIVSAIGFFMLVFVLAYYGLRVASLMREGKAQISFQPKKSSNVQVVSVTAVIFLLFTTRAIFNVLSAVDTIGFTVESVSMAFPFPFICFMAKLTPPLPFVCVLARGWS